jgi:hypothetical protein
MLLEVTVLFYPDDYDEEEYADIGKKLVMVKSVMIVNTDHLVAWHSNDKGMAMIHLSCGEIYETTTKFSELRTLMEEEQLSKDMFVSGEN